LYELLFKGLFRTAAQKRSGRRMPVGRMGGAQADLDEAWVRSPDGGLEAESGYPLRLIIGIQRDNSTYFSNA
jgi:hypothetical protein